MKNIYLLISLLAVAHCAHGSAKLSTCLPAAKVGRTAAVVICPGGGYTTLCDTYEGDDMARWLVERGVAAFVLRYRLAPKYHGKEMLEDIREALRYVREHAEELNVDPHRVGVLGFSAGGHLACLAGTTDADWRADFMALVYAHISMAKDIGHGHMREKFLGAGATDEDIRQASGELLVNERTPPAFLVHARTDEVCSVEHSRRFAAAMRKKGRPVDYLELESGRHGLGCGRGEHWHKWLDAFEKWLREMGVIVADDVNMAVRPIGGDQPEWNAHAEWFMYAPSFAFREIPGAVRYRFQTIDDYHVIRAFTADRPSDSLAPMWENLPKGFVTVMCFALDGKDEVVGLAGERTFWKNAPFREGAYPKAKRSYAESVKMGLAYLLNRPANRYFLENGKPDPSYDLNCYPAKMHSATIEAMCDYMRLDLPRKDEALKLAHLCADYLIAISEPEGRPLAGWPHTYEGKNNTAAQYAGQQMLVYPARAGNAYLSFFAVTKDTRYLGAAERVAATYLKLQGEDGTWHLKLYENDGRSVSKNRLMPNGVIDFLERLYDVTGDERYRTAADRAFAYIDNGPLKTWNWEGQFEDVPPSEPYFNLTKHFACDTAIYLLNRYPRDKHRRQQAAEILRWPEDQFIAWETPARKDGIGYRNRPGFKACWSHGWQTKYSIWHCPAVMEQYAWYQPIDASAAKLIRTYLAYYKATGDTLSLAKAKALGDAAVNNQRESGLSPTGWFGNYDEYHNWINGHIATIQALQELCAF